jgi:hypothetical protein
MYFLYYLAALQLYLGDKPGHRATCRQLLALAADAVDSGDGERAAKALLLDDDLQQGPELRAAARLASRALRDGTRSPMVGWFRLADGMAEYRAQRFDTAVQRLQQADLVSDDPAGQALTDLYLAMALQRSGKSTEARSADWSDLWLDWMHCRIALKEAEHILGEPAIVPTLQK